MTITHDVIVVGAGPAGASAARALCRRGLSVALIDKAAFPRDKLCGGGITGRCAGYLEEVFGPLPDTLPDALFLDTHRVRMVAEGRVIADIADAPRVRMTMRRSFDAALQAAAVGAGAEDLSGRRIAALDPAAAAVRLDCGRALRGRVLIGADGANSAIGRALFGRAFDPAQIGFGLEVEVAGAVAGGPVPGDPVPGDPVMELDLTAAAWGYGWAFPKRHGVTIGVGGLLARNADMKTALAGYLARCGVAAGDLRVKGAHLPFGDARAVPGRGLVLLAGDAAGFVDPITGEGIGWAVKSGDLAAGAVAAALAAGDPGQALPGYVQATAHLRAEIGRARLLRGLIYHPLVRRHFIGALARAPRVQRRYLALLAGQMDYADIGWSAVARLIGRMVAGRKG